MSLNSPANLDATQESVFLEFLKKLPEKQATSIRIFDRGEYYSLYGQDAVFASKEIFKTTGVVKYLGREKVEYISLGKNNVRIFLRELLIVRQYCVELYQSKNPGSRNSVDWTVTARASPGNLTQFEGILFEDAEPSQDTLAVAALQVSGSDGQKIVGFGYCDVNARKLLVCEFPDNDSFTNTAALLAQLGPREVLLPDSGMDAQRLKQTIDRSGALATDKKKSEFSAKDIVQDLNHLLAFKKSQKGTASTLPEISLTNACGSLSAVIKFTDILMDESSFNSFKLSTFDFSRYMRLDSSALKALHVLPMPGQQTLHSLVGLVDKCRTPQGSRTLSQWIRQPLLDRLQLEARLDLVQAFVDNQSLCSSLSEDILKRVPDLQKLAIRLLRKKGTLQDCYKTYLALAKLPTVIEAFESDSELLSRTLGIRLSDALKETEKLKELIESTIDLSKASEGDYIIRPDFDEDLEDLQNSIGNVEERMQKALNRAARDLNLESGKTLKLEDAPHHGMCYRITMKEEKGIRNNRNYTILDVTKGGVRFRDAALTDLSSDFKEKRGEYEEAQKRIVAEVIKIAAGYFEPLLCVNEVVAEIDALLSLALSAINAPIPWVRPTLRERGSGVLKLTQIRHPCLEAIGNCAVIPNDAVFSEGEGKFHIITGPNMGGKSTYLRTTGLCVLLAQVGSFVPCEAAEISLVDAIFTRVGAGDIMMRGVSTFMAEMLETSVILKTATSDSLILIDELGRGTSTYDGFGLAWAISKKIASDLTSYCLFATHFHELTRMAQTVPSVRNSHVTAITDGKTLTMLYKLEPGVCDQSFGIHVAEMAKFPERVLKIARSKVLEYESLSDSTSNCSEISKLKEFLNSQLVPSGVNEGKYLEAAREIKQRFIKA